VTSSSTSSLTFGNLLFSVTTIEPATLERPYPTHHSKQRLTKAATRRILSPGHLLPTSQNSQDGTSRNRQPREQWHVSRDHCHLILPRRDQRSTHSGHNHHFHDHWKDHIDIRICPSRVDIPARYALHRLQPSRTTPWTSRRTRAFERARKNRMGGFLDRYTGGGIWRCDNRRGHATERHTSHNYGRQPEREDRRRAREMLG
jgi:hypothetical protein